MCLTYTLPNLRLYVNHCPSPFHSHLATEYVFGMVFYIMRVNIVCVCLIERGCFIEQVSPANPICTQAIASRQFLNDAPFFVKDSHISKSLQ